MNYALINTSSFILGLVFAAYIALILLRFYMQFFRVGFSNPMGQFIIRSTNPLLMPLRRVVPPIKSLDSASMVLAFIIHMAFVFCLALINRQEVNIFQVLLWSGTGLLTMSMAIYLPLIFLSVIASWLPDLRYQPIMQVVYGLVEPVIQPFRRILPNLGGIDLSPIIPLLIMQVIKIFLTSFPILIPFFILGY